MKKILIVVPCYNEEKRLDVQAFSNYSINNPDIHFLFVNDASTDDTKAVIENLCNVNKRQISTIDLSENSGKAEAVRRGFLKAFEYEPDYIGFWDADLSTPLDAINSFIPYLDRPKINLVMGSRVQLLGRNVERLMTRHYFGRIFATVASTILNLKVYDTQCGAKLFKNDNELKVVFSLPFNVKWTFDVEILARLILLRKIKCGLPVEETVVEFPLLEWKDVPGSKVRFKDGFKAIYELYQIFSFLNFPGASQTFRKSLSRIGC